MRTLKSAFAIALLLPAVTGGTTARANDSLLPDFVFARPHRQPGSGVPDNLDPAISRGECPQLEALVPTEIPVVEIVSGLFVDMPRQSWGLTASDAPVIWFRVDRSVPNARFEMVLKNDDGSVVDTYEKTLSVDDRLFAVPLAADSLTRKDVSYSFVGSMEIECATIEGTAPQVLSIASGGQIDRVAPPVSVASLENPKALAVAYAEAGLWFDAFNIVAELHQLDAADAWVNAALADLLLEAEPVKLIQE